MIDSDQFTRISKALADPRRFELLQMIAGEDEVRLGVRDLVVMLLGRARRRGSDG